MKILLVHQDPALLELLRRWVESAGYEVRCARDAEQAVAAVSACLPEVIITGGHLPKVDSLEFCRWLKQQVLPRCVYTIFIPGGGSEEFVEAVEAGADDFLKQPLDQVELLARLRAGARLLALENQLSVLARSDSLTGLPTRRTFYELMQREWCRAARHHIPLSCVMIDVDHFKQINDTYGHRVGDQALQTVADILQENCRSSDVVGRYGGEEFCVLLPETSEENAIAWADRVRQRLAERNDLVEEQQMAITASFGVAERLADTSSPEQLIDMADQALLVAKRAGRDQVVGFQMLAATSPVQSERKVQRSDAAFRGLAAKDAMTPIVAGLDQEETVGRAAEYFLQLCFSSAPVVDRAGKLIGILSDREILAITLGPRWWTTKIKEVVQRNVVCYDEETPVALIYEFLCRVCIPSVVIVKEGRPTGIVSRSSLLRWFTNMMAISPRTLVVERSDRTQEFRDGLSPRAAKGNSLGVLARALESEAANLQQIPEQLADAVPALIAGVSRMQELLNDLLACARYGYPTPGAGCGADAAGLAAQNTRQMRITGPLATVGGGRIPGDRRWWYRQSTGSDWDALVPV